MSRVKDPLGSNYWRLLVASVVSNLGDGIVRAGVVAVLVATIAIDQVGVVLLYIVTFVLGVLRPCTRVRRGRCCRRWFVGISWTWPTVRCPRPR
jgi:hypothetical protein